MSTDLTDENPERQRRQSAVRVERERGDDLGGWLTLAGACGWLHGSYDDAIIDAREIAAGYGVAVASSAGRVAPC